MTGITNNNSFTEIMNTTTSETKYPTAVYLVGCIKKFITANDIIVSDWDDFVYEFISEYDSRFPNDANWYSEDNTDIKDNLRDEVLEILGVV